MAAGDCLVELQQIDESIEEQIESKLFAPIRKVWELVRLCLCFCVPVLLCACDKMMYTSCVHHFVMNTLFPPLHLLFLFLLSPPSPPFTGNG